MPKRTQNPPKTHPNYDSLILGLGEVLQSLVDDINRLDNEQDSTTDSRIANRASQLINETYNRIFDIQKALSALPASSLEAAAVQMRAVNSEVNLNTEDSEARALRLNYSILNVLESHGAGDRDQWAGEYFITKRCDPFQRVLTN